MSKRRKVSQTDVESVLVESNVARVHIFIVLLGVGRRPTAERLSIEPVVRAGTVVTIDVPVELGVEERAKCLFQPNDRVLEVCCAASDRVPVAL